MKSQKSLYSTCLKNLDNKLHFIAHSHHPWPDAVGSAHSQYIHDSMLLLDKKWEHIFSKIYPKAQQNLAKLLNLAPTRYTDIFFAQNTHQILIKIFSALGIGIRKLRVLTSTSEFYSFQKQADQWKTLGWLDIDALEISPDLSHEQKILQRINSSSNHYDVIFLSHVFFDTGIVLRNLKSIIKAASQRKITLVIDGYHALGAIDVDLSDVKEDDFFYIGGGYKYLQAGEGACFCLIPQITHHSPYIVSWLSDFIQTHKLTLSNGKYQYFLSSTFDPSGLYRLNQVFKYIFDVFSSKEIRSYILELKSYFIKQWKEVDHELKNTAEILNSDPIETGSFITLKNLRQLSHNLNDFLRKKDILVDSRGAYTRVGLGIYHEKKDIEEFFKRIAL